MNSVPFKLEAEVSLRGIQDSKNQTLQELCCPSLLATERSANSSVSTALLIRLLEFLFFKLFCDLLYCVYSIPLFPVNFQPKYRRVNDPYMIISEATGTSDNVI